MAWQRACSTSDIEEGDAFLMEGGPAIAVFNVGGEYFALDDLCSHDRSSLADGYIEGDQVECSWHFAKFCIRTGAVLSPPATTPVQSYPVQISGEDVLVDLP